MWLLAYVSIIDTKLGRKSNMSGSSLESIIPLLRSRSFIKNCIEILQLDSTQRAISWPKIMLLIKKISLKCFRVFPFHPLSLFKISYRLKGSVIRTVTSDLRGISEKIFLNNSGCIYIWSGFPFISSILSTKIMKIFNITWREGEMLYWKKSKWNQIVTGKTSLERKDCWLEHCLAQNSEHWQSFPE